MPKVQTNAAAPPGHQIVRNVPVFREHVTTDAEGNEVVYDRQALELIAMRCQRRIDESGDYAALCIGHNPTPEDAAKGAPTPRLVGFAGNWRVAPLRDSGEYAIFTDWYVKPRDIETLREYPRRSPELWLEPTMAERFIDPIALLGSEVPRLDLGMMYAKGGKVAKYAINASGVRVAKYEAAYPSGGNTFVKSDDYNKTEDYAKDSAMDPAMIEEVLAALQSTDVWQYMTAKMQEEAGPESSAGVDGLGGGEDLAPMDAGAPPMDMGMGGPEDVEQDMRGGAVRRMAADNSPPGDSTEHPGQPAKTAQVADGDAMGTGTQPDNPSPYAKALAARSTRDSYAKLVTEHERLKGTVATLVRERDKAEVYQRLSDMRREGIIFEDIDKEAARVMKLSRADRDEQFESIVANYQKAPVGYTIHAPDDGLTQPGTKADVEAVQYSKKLYDATMEIANESARSGKVLSYDEVREIAKDRVKHAG